MDAKTQQARNWFAKRLATAPLICLAMMVLASTASAGTIQIRKQATVQTRDIRLRDVATVSDDLPSFYGVLVVGRFDAKFSQLNVTDAHIRKAITDRGENIVAVNFGGFEVCRVAYKPLDSDRAKRAADSGSSKKPIRSVDATVAPVLSNPAEEVGLDARLTVQQCMVDWLVSQSHVQRDALHVEFDERDAAVLNGSAWRDRFVFTTSSRSMLGRLPITITRIRDDKLVDTQRVTVEVAKRQLAAVATRDLKRGDVIRSTDLEIREVKLTRDHGTVVVKLADVIGQVVKGSLREGRVVSVDDVEAPLLIRRNEMVQVKAVSGGLLLQTFGRAMGDGALGELIKIRNENSKETFFARVIGKRMATLEVQAPRSSKATAQADKRK